MEPHDTIQRWWDDDASVYDESAGHAISDPVEAAAWRRALEATLPDPVARVLDVGTGTGALALLIAELGHAVTGLDLSEGMLERARAKADEAGASIVFGRGRAEDPPPRPRPGRPVPPSCSCTAVPRTLPPARTTRSSSGMCCGRCRTRSRRCGPG